MLIESRQGGASYTFADQQGEVTALVADQVRPALERVEAAVEAGLHAAGFLSYEAASGLDPTLTTHPSGALPLVWFGLYGERREAAPTVLDGISSSYSLGPWQPDVPESAYRRSVERIRELIAAGDTYQVNYTYRLGADFSGDPRGLYRDLIAAQAATHCALVQTGPHWLVSASPELFFALDGGRLTARPMKGTARRGRWLAEDEGVARRLRDSAKERAENVMIVDLLRNDLGRVARHGSVHVPHLWQTERYETVWQLTSTVRAEVGDDVGFAGLMAALFPCGSVTGAPKVRTMEIIRELETSPRGAYTGCIGYVSPARGAATGARAGARPLAGVEARFNVAIRTVHVDVEQGAARYGVGGGITWDSRARLELEESRTKARVLGPRRPAFDLLETLLFEPEEGYYLLDRHLARLAASARYFGFTWRGEVVRRVLDATADGLVAAAGPGDGAHRVRLTVGRNGRAQATTARLEQAGAAPLIAAVDGEPVNSEEVLVYHKTTLRQPFAEALSRHPGCGEVILQNERGELTECTIGNLVVVRGGRALTPPVTCGLLAGTYRAELLERGELTEAVLEVGDLAAAESLYTINSVRRWVPLVLAPSESDGPDEGAQPPTT